jgi:hypothetical protein
MMLNMVKGQQSSVVIRHTIFNNKKMIRTNVGTLLDVL